MTNDKYQLVASSTEVPETTRKHTSSQLRRLSSEVINKATFDIVFVISLKK